MGFKVTPDQLRQAGTDIVGTADALNADIDAHSGAQDADASANANLATAKALAQCETGWEQALTVVGTKMAVAGDKLVVNAQQYAANEQATTASLASR
ncbi:hypothetical protein [Actinocrispum wychmicini]|uniref:Excreted virulence factor EspC (Type VII ESX diderm) n=1 Tax=Actinocrispum wychmicini TaxID=1213861 RepID=A0A4R2J2C6_9PSEU|nr:hypothetical protein [Actinocrispum wychmicini]TCO52373.1 hypothetical protein EV192_112105 [Actinocrispum wychmicini]